MIAVGIDLGTTNSCIYYLDSEGNPVLVEDAKGRPFFPSAVWCAGQGKELVVGHRAKARMGSQPAPVIAVKRKMGTDDRVLLGGKQASAVEVSTHILRHAKALVEEKSGDKVGAVIVTMPAYFDLAAKKDTRLAVVQAFFDGVEEGNESRFDLQLEPEAAAYAYTIENKDEKLKVLVYDLGGGTFDVTVLEKTPTSGLQVLKFGGDPHLGGDNVDDRIVTWILYLLRGGNEEALQRVLTSGKYPADRRYTVFQQLIANDQEGLGGVLRPEDRDLLIPDKPRYQLDLAGSDPEDLARIQKLKLLAEDAKKDLTTTTEVAIVKQGAFTDHDGDLVDVSLTLSRKDFNLLIGDMIDKTMQETQRVVSSLDMTPADFDRVLLVGGSSRMPVVREELQKIFSCPAMLADPDLIVARGAALRARALNPQAAPAGDGRMVLDYPRQSSDTVVTIAGKLAEEVSRHHAYLTREGKTIAEAPVEKDRFLLKEVELNPDSENVFHLEVVDYSDKAVAETDLRIRHTLNAGPSGPVVDKITKPFRCLGMKGFKIIFHEGEMLPATKKEKCFWTGVGDAVVIPFFEGERHLQDLRITNLDPTLNEGTPIMLQITIQKNYKVSATATLEATGQKADVEFQIERLKIPSEEEMDKAFQEKSDEIRDAVTALHDPNKRAEFNRALRQLDAEYKKARHASTPDRHHLFTLNGELGKLQTEVESSRNFLSPALEEFQHMLDLCRAKVAKLPPSGAIRKEDVMKKLELLEHAGTEAFEANHSPDWKNINQQLGKELESLTIATQPPPPDISTIPAYVFQKQLLEYMAEIRQKIQDHKLDGHYETEAQSIEAAARKIDMHDNDRAREEIIRLYRVKVAPLGNKVDQEIRNTGATPSSTSTVVFSY